MASRGFIELLRLADLAEARRTGRNNPDQEDWLGIVFESAGQKMIAPLGEVSEVLSFPELTALPLVQPWLLGVANVRGRLLPLTDLSKFLGLQSEVRLKNRKVMVIDQDDVFSGLLVDQVLGISRFVQADYVAEEMPKQSPFSTYNHGKFVKSEEESYFVFMPSLLIKDKRFLDASLD